MVERPFARIGSLDGSEIRLDSPGIAAKCLYLHATDDGVFCVPLGYAGGSTCHGWLQPNQTVKLCDHLISARLAGSGTCVGRGNSLLDARGSAVAPFPVISVRHRGREIHKCRLTRQLAVVGRRRPSHLRIKHQRMSAYHCVLSWCDGVLWIVDLLSTNKTFLDGHAVKASPLQLGASVRIGRDLEIAFVSVSERPSEHAPTGEAPSHAPTDPRLGREDLSGDARVQCESRLAMPEPSPLANETSAGQLQSNGPPAAGPRLVSREDVEIASPISVPSDGEHQTDSRSDAVRTDDYPPRIGETLDGKQSEKGATSSPSTSSAELDDDDVSPLVAFAQKKRGVFLPRLNRALIVVLWMLAVGALAVFAYLAWQGRNILGFEGVFQ